jgi:hypothetical protein
MTEEEGKEPDEHLACERRRPGSAADHRPGQPLAALPSQWTDNSPCELGERVWYRV